MIFTILAYLTFLIIIRPNDAFDVSDLRLTPGEGMQAFLAEEVLLETLLNPTLAVQDDKELINNLFDPVMMPEKDISFELYTRTNPAEPYHLKLDDIHKLNQSPFRPDRPTKILIHGWTDSAKTYWLQDVRRNYLMVGDYNVICLNWFPGSMKEYFISAKLTRQIGAYLANFLNFLVQRTGLSLNDVHILGHSLGAHIAGFTGLELNGKIGRITGMDPARPLFETPHLKDPKDRLDATHANFVDIIHTCAGTVGFVRPIGHVDFFPNGGSFRQPGCPVLLTQYCSHGRSHQFMAESIIFPKNFMAIRCENYSDFKAHKCKTNATTTYMGEKVDKTARGTFYLETNPEFPFGKGAIFV